MIRLCLGRISSWGVTSSVAMQRQTQTTEAVSMETVSYVVGVDVGVVPLQPVVQDGDDDSFACDAFLPHRDHVQVQLRQRGRRPRVLLEDEMTNFRLKCGNDTGRVIGQALKVLLWEWKGHPLSAFCADLYRNSLRRGRLFSRHRGSSPGWVGHSAADWRYELLCCSAQQFADEFQPHDALPTVQPTVSPDSTHIQPSPLDCLEIRPCGCANIASWLFEWSGGAEKVKLEISGEWGSVMSACLPACWTVWFRALLSGSLRIMHRHCRTPPRDVTHPCDVLPFFLLLLAPTLIPCFHAALPLACLYLCLSLGGISSSRERAERTSGHKRVLKWFLFQVSSYLQFHCFGGDIEWLTSSFCKSPCWKSVQN